MKKIKIGILVLSLLTLTGCGNNYIMEGKEQVKYSETGQVLQKDILCKPEDEDLDELYTKYKDQTKIDYEELPKCSEFKLTSNKADGIWAAIDTKQV